MENDRNKVDVKDMTLKELREFLERIGEQKFRGDQIFSWLACGASNFEEMKNLSKQLKEKLTDRADITNLKILKVQVSKSDGTRKYLFGLSDGTAIETVFMKYKHGNSICVSSQAGCRMGCHFCASSINGLERNLSAAEILDQIISVERDTGEKISNIVIMGTGEPFDNYENLSHFLKIAHEPKGLNFSLRSITVSTCGILPVMKKFGQDFPQVNLAVSLHASKDSDRSRLMPINKEYPMEDVLAACRDHIQQTGRRVTFEYALVQDVNDKKENAEELARILHGMNCHVNLIPLNPVSEREFVGTDRHFAEEFKELLEKKKIQVTIRRELGSDIDAACGQLRLNGKN